tara:strand:+ start:2996 stop:3247 length:252 start_codon:yes stop_codon:yes gene_type:complete
MNSSNDYYKQQMLEVEKNIIEKKSEIEDLMAVLEHRMPSNFPNSLYNLEMICRFSKKHIQHIEFLITQYRDLKRKIVVYTKEK